MEIQLSDLEFHAPRHAKGRAKVTIHTSGKLGLSKEAIKQMNINNIDYIKIATMKNDTKREILYFITLNQKEDNAFKVIKAGEYFSLNTRGLFDDFEIDYKNNKIAYDLIDSSNIEGNKVYKFKRRIIGRR